MKINRFKSRKPSPLSSEKDLRRRRRETILIFVILAVVGILTYTESRVIHFGADFPISNTILMFILININLLLLILLIFLVFRNLVKLFFERRRNVTGAKLRTKLVVAFIALSLLPTIVLFFFSINFITTSIEFWFNVPVEQALENSLQVGRQLYAHIEENNKFFLRRIAYQIRTKKLLDMRKRKALNNYIHVVQRAFNLDLIEIYRPDAKRLAMASSASLSETPAGMVNAGSLLGNPSLKSLKPSIRSLPNGELVRSIGTVPFGVSVAKAKAIVTLGVMIPSDLSNSMSSISRGFEQYQQMKLLKKPIQSTYYITLSIVALLVVFCAIWFGFYLAKSISIPIQLLAEGTRRVAEGDLSFRINPVSDDEVGSLVESFNKMTADLQASRQQLEHSSKMLQQQNIEIEERRRYMEIVLKNVSAGVITLDAGGSISTINKSAEKLLNLRADDVLGKDYQTLLKGQHLNLAEEVLESLSTTVGNTAEWTLRLTIDGSPRTFLLSINVLKDDAGRNMGMVMVFDDLTELEKAQRMAAWREVARRIAHEVKNPLTPISLSAQRLKRRYSQRLNEPVFEECTRMIIDHVELIRNLVNEFSAFARFPTANLMTLDLPPIIEETVALYREGHPQIAFEISIADEIPLLKLDRQQIKQALINLVDNAIAAMRAEGHIWITVSCDNILKLVRMEIADDGSGISDEDKTRLFEPNFSTKKSGMGLGLTIVNSIVLDHNGMIRVQDNHPRGAKFIIELPVELSDSAGSGKVI